MKNLLFILFIFLGFSADNIAQNYESAVGIRLGYPNAITYKKFISESNAIEVYGGVRSQLFFTSINVNAAYLIHAPIESVDGLNWYYGFGAGAVFYSYDAGFGGDGGGVGASINGYIGVEYTLVDAPLTISLDWIPSVLIGGGDAGFGERSGGLAVRYVLGRE